jgi:hypothetical protein
MTEAIIDLPTVPVGETQGTLALELVPRHDPPVVVPRARPGGDVVPIDVRRREQTEAWVARFAQAAVEIVGGDRPPSQLVRWTTETVYADLERRAQLVAQAGAHRPGTARVQPVRPTVVGVRTSFVQAWTVEAAFRIRFGHRSRAVAARFDRIRDGSGDRWVCTALEWA